MDTLFKQLNNNKNRKPIKTVINGYHALINRRISGNNRTSLINSEITASHTNDQYKNSITWYNENVPQFVVFSDFCYLVP